MARKAPSLGKAFGTASGAKARAAVGKALGKKKNTLSKAAIRRGDAGPVNRARLGKGRGSPGGAEG